MFEVSSSAAGVVLRAAAGPRGRSGRPAPPGGAPTAQTDEEGTVVALGEAGAVDAEVRERAQRIAARLSLPRPRHDLTARRGGGELASVPYRGSADDIDLDRTLEVLAERPVPDDEDIVVRERVRARRSIVLLVDVSGSMRGERVRTAAATVGALSAELTHDDLGVIAFWSDAAVLLRLGGEISPSRLLDDILRIPAQGLTNVAFPLGLAAQELSRAPAREARVVLLSDCVHNAGPDPRPAAARLPRLDVLLDATGENDLQLGRELARRGQGICRVVHDYRDVAPALAHIFRA